MRSSSATGLTAGYADDLRSARERVQRADAAIAAGEVARVRALADAGRIAQRAARAQRASVRIHDMALREVASDIAAATRSSDRSLQRQIGDALVLVDDFPATVDAWEVGALSRAHVRAITDIGTTLPLDRRAEFDALASVMSADESPARARARLALLAERMQPTTPTERHRAAREHRAVRVIATENGMSDLIATLPTVLAQGIYDRLTHQARVIVDARAQAANESAHACDGAHDAAPRSGLRTDDRASRPAAGRPVDTRTTDQIRADILADMLLAAAPLADPTADGDRPGALGKIRAKVQVIVPALTMLAPSRENLEPAQIVGHGPIDAASARFLAESSPLPWDRVVTHPISGAVLHVDTYQRTAAIDRYVRARDRHCRWPGCALPAVRCEVDHSLDYAAGGATDVRNLATLCQRHHSMKQFTGWGLEHLDGGVLVWTSPTGLVYVDEPEPYSRNVRFTPDDDPPSERRPHPAHEAAPF